VLINPTLEPIGAEMEEGWEGCLWCPACARRVRYSQVRYRGFTSTATPSIAWYPISCPRGPA